MSHKVIMCVGNSITVGSDAEHPTDFNSYRKALWYLGDAAGWDFSFVGPNSNGTDSGWDKDHAGYGGYRVDQITALIAGLISTYQPHIILLLIGVNTVAQQIVSGDPQTVIADWGTLLDTIYAADPTVNVLMSPLTPAFPTASNPLPFYTERVIEANAGLAGVVSAARAGGQLVQIAHVGDQIFVSEGAISSDGTHPSESGYTSMAGLWYSALHQFFTSPITEYVLPKTVGGRVYVSLDGSGLFTGDNDRLLRSVKSLTLDEGRDGVQQLDPPKIQAGTVVLRNENGQYSVDRANSPYYQQLIPGRPVLYQVEHGEARAYRSDVRYHDNLYYRGVGLVPLGRHVVYDLTHTSAIGQRQATLTTLGWEVMLTKAKVTIPYMDQPLVSECFTAYLDAVGWPVDKRDISVSDTRLARYYAADRVPWDGMLELLASEGPGAFGVRRDGTFYFENRNYRSTAVRSTVSRATYNDTREGSGVLYRSAVGYRDDRYYRGRMSSITHTNLQQGSPFKSIYNRATYTTRRREAAGSPSVVWSLGADVSFSAGQGRTFVAKPSDPFINAIVPVLTTDYTVTGGTVSVALSATGGLVTTILITATSGTPTVSGLQLRAETLALVSETTLENTVDASASIARFSPIPGQNIPLTYDVQGWPEVEPATAEAVCDAWVLRQMWPRPKVTFSLQGNDTGQTTDEILERRPSDRVTIMDAHSGISDDFWINASKLTIQDAQGRVFWLDVSAELCDTLTGAVWSDAAALWNDLSTVWGI